jgi:catalase
LKPAKTESNKADQTLMNKEGQNNHVATQAECMAARSITSANTSIAIARDPHLFERVISSQISLSATHLFAAQRIWAFVESSCNKIFSDNGRPAGLRL